MQSKVLEERESGWQWSVGEEDGIYSTSDTEGTEIWKAGPIEE